MIFVLTNSADPDEMLYFIRVCTVCQNACYQLTLFILDTGKQVRTLANGERPLKYKMDNSVLLVSICMGQSIRMKRINNSSDYCWKYHDCFMDTFYIVLPDIEYNMILVKPADICTGLDKQNF